MSRPARPIGHRTGRGDPVEPSGYVSVAAELRQATVGLYVDLLDDVTRIFAVADHPIRERVHTQIGRLDEGRERGLVAFDRGTDDGVV